MNSSPIQRMDTSQAAGASNPENTKRPKAGIREEAPGESRDLSQIIEQG